MSTWTNVLPDGHSLAINDASEPSESVKQSDGRKTEQEVAAVAAKNCAAAAQSPPSRHPVPEDEGERNDASINAGTTGGDAIPVEFKLVGSAVASQRQSPVEPGAPYHESPFVNILTKGEVPLSEETVAAAALREIDATDAGEPAGTCTAPAPRPDGPDKESTSSSTGSAPIPTQPQQGSAGRNAASGTGLFPPYPGPPLPHTSMNGMVPSPGVLFPPNFYYFPFAYPMHPFHSPDQQGPTNNGPTAALPANKRAGAGAAIRAPASAAAGAGAAAPTASTPAGPSAKRRKMANCKSATEAKDASDAAAVVPRRKASGIDTVADEKSLGRRRDVPDDVKALVRFLRNQAVKEQKALHKQLQSVQQALDDERKAHGELKAALHEAGFSVTKKPTPSVKPSSAGAVGDSATATGIVTDKVGKVATLPPSSSIQLLSMKNNSLPLQAEVQIRPKKHRELRGPSWTWDSAIEALRHFEKGNGHLRVPTRSHLGRWVMEIRASYKAYKARRDKQANDQQSSGQPAKSNVHHPSEQSDEPGMRRADQAAWEDLRYPGPCTLTRERVKLLESMGFEWCLAPPTVPWSTRCDDLEAFCMLHGHARVPRTGEYASLGEWVKGVRIYYKEKNPYLTPERVERLSKIPHFSLATENQKLSFDERLEECREFRREHGHLGVYPLRNIPDMPKKERSFRWWAHNIRLAYRKFKMGRKTHMDANKIKKLGTSDQRVCVERLRSLNAVVYPFPGDISEALGFVFELPDLRRDRTAGRKYVDGEADEEDDEEEEEEEDADNGDMLHVTELAIKGSNGQASI